LERRLNQRKQKIATSDIRGDYNSLHEDKRPMYEITDSFIRKTYRENDLGGRRSMDKLLKGKLTISQKPILLSFTELTTLHSLVRGMNRVKLEKKLEGMIKKKSDPQHRLGDIFTHRGRAYIIGKVNVGDKNYIGLISTKDGNCWTTGMEMPKSTLWRKEEIISIFGTNEKEFIFIHK